MLLAGVSLDGFLRLPHVMWGDVMALDAYVVLLERGLDDRLRLDLHDKSGVLHAFRRAPV